MHMLDVVANVSSIDLFRRFLVMVVLGLDYCDTINKYFICVHICVQATSFIIRTEYNDTHMAQASVPPRPPTGRKISKEYDRYNPWFWVDMETSGLDPMTSEVLEVNIVVTDSRLDVWDSIHIVLHHPMNILMMKSSAWCKRKFCAPYYGGNGLFDECHYSNTTHEDANFMLWNFFEYYSSHEVGKGRPGRTDRAFFDKTMGANGNNLTSYDISSTAYTSKSPHRLVLLAGSTVHFDRGFLVEHFPDLKRFLNHKNIDVTTLLETAKRFRPDILDNKPRPSVTHRAMDDILDSIHLYKYFKEEVFDKAVTDKEVTDKAVTDKAVTDNK